MQESKDPGIKLFGKKIHLPADGEISTLSVDEFDKAQCGNRVVDDEDYEEFDDDDDYDGVGGDGDGDGGEEEDEQKDKTEQVGQFNKTMFLFNLLGDFKDYPFLEMVKN